MRICHIASEYPPLRVFGLGRAVHDLAMVKDTEPDWILIVDIDEVFEDSIVEAGDDRGCDQAMACADVLR
jgi:hypothetical protein